MLNKTKLNFLAALCLTFGLGGCLTPAPEATGPIQLSPRANQALAGYAERYSPTTFVVSVDGSSAFYSFCQDYRCQPDNPQRVIDRCEEISGKKCVVYAEGGRYVWNNEPVHGRTW
jgi:hypothetical protein